jgi:hypothetical protein
MYDFSEHTAELGGDIDVPLSVWPIWSERHMVERLIDQFTVTGETIALIDLPGIRAIIESNRHGVVYCDQATAERERRELADTAGGCEYGPAIVEAIDAQTAPGAIARLHDTALTVCADGRSRDAAAWSAIVRTVRAFGLLAVVWNDTGQSARSRQACEAAGLSYAGHIVAAEVDEFDRASATADGLSGLDRQHPRRAHTNVALWARYPDQVDGGVL